VPEPVAGMGWYVSIFGGASFAKDEDFYALNSTGCYGYYGCYYQSVDANLDLDTGFMAGAALGIGFNDWLRGEVEVSGNFHNVGGDAYFDFEYRYSSDYVGNADLDGDENALF